MAIRSILAISTFFISATLAQAIVPSYRTWASPRCYNMGPKPLLLSIGFADLYMTLQRCLDEASNRGYLFAGIYDGKTCLAGNVIRSALLPSSFCDRPCVSNPSQICGGANSVIIYRDGPVFVPAPYSSLSGWNWIGCSVQCSKFKLVGIRNGNQCFCGNALLNNATLLHAAGGPCDTGCEENPHEECGGPSAFTVYHYDLDSYTSGPGKTIQKYKDWTLLNCFTDMGSKRTLSMSVNFGEDMALEQCLDVCSGRGFSLAGVEYGQECYCGNTIQSPGTVATSGCDAMQCVSDANQLCGGPDRLLVYKRQ